MSGAHARSDEPMPGEAPECSGATGAASAVTAGCDDKARKSGSDDKTGKAGLGGWLKSKTNELKAHTKEMRENTMVIARDIAGGTQKEKGPRMGEERIEFTFMQRALGLELDLREAVVRAVKPGGQAESLQVREQDRLVAIDGEPLPQVEEEDQFIEALKARMSKMPRPVTLTFARACALPDDEEKVDEGEQILDLVKQRMQKLPGPVLGFGRGGGKDDPTEVAELRELVQRLEVELQAAKEELQAVKEDSKAANADAITAVEEAASLRADLADLQLSKVWCAQETKRCQLEAEATSVKVTTARESAAELATELEITRGQCAALERALATTQREESEQRAEASLQMAHAVELAAAVAELESAREELSRQLRQAHDEMQAAQAAQVEMAQQRLVAAADAEERMRELKRLHAASAEEVHDLKAREAGLRARASAASSSLEAALADVERHKAGAAAAEEVAVGLRREVDRLQRGDRSADATQEEAAPDAGEPRGGVEPERALQREVAATTAGVAAEASPAALVEEDPSLLIPAGRQLGAGSFDSFGDVENARICELEACIQELQEKNASLTRQLSARPIVYQFSPDDNDPDVAYEDDPEVVVPTRATEDVGRAGVSAIICTAAVGCQRNTMRGMKLCRKQKPTQAVEKSLRLFTRSLLRRPLLLWLFYAHVLALWTMEGWRQAALHQATVQNPAAKIDKMFQAAAATP